VEIKGEEAMANLALVYGMRLFPAEELDEVNEALMRLKNGNTARIQMRLIWSLQFAARFLTAPTILGHCPMKLWVGPNLESEAAH
jgi:hypothetical protein